MPCTQGAVRRDVAQGFLVLPLDTRFGDPGQDEGGPQQLILQVQAQVTCKRDRGSGGPRVPLLLFEKGWSSSLQAVPQHCLAPAHVLCFREQQQAPMAPPSDSSPPPGPFPSWCWFLGALSKRPCPQALPLSPAQGPHPIHPQGQAWGWGSVGWPLSRLDLSSDSGHQGVRAPRPQWALCPAVKSLAQMPGPRSQLLQETAEGMQLPGTWSPAQPAQPWPCGKCGE